jgi:predicted NAD/FAD-dependent oxidoreductase
MNDYLVIGGGISGITFAKQAAARGLNGLILEKSRGLGGRMSTRRVTLDSGEEIAFDHGAQFFTLRNSLTKEILIEQIHRSEILQWHTEITHADYPRSIKKSERWIAPQGMSSLVKSLAEGLPIKTESKVIGVKYNPGSEFWEVITESHEIFQTKMLVLSCPIPQALALVPELKSVGPLSSADYRPCVAVMLARREDFKVGKQGARWGSYRDSIEWICDNKAKGISKTPSLTVHMSEDFSRKNQELSDSDLIQKVRRMLNSLGEGEMLYEAVHRWRYSQPLSPSWEIPYFEKNGLVLVGDGFTGGRIEGALQSAYRASLDLLPHRQKSAMIGG